MVDLHPSKESGKFPTEAEQAAWWAGYSTSEQAVEALLAERDALREALKRIAAMTLDDAETMIRVAHTALERTP